MKKIVATMGLALGLAGLSFPADAQAATALSVEGVDPGAKTVTIAFTDGRVGDWYHIYANDKVLFNTLNAEDVQFGKKSIDVSALGDLIQGGEVWAELRSHTFPQYLHARYVIGQGAQTKAISLQTQSTLVANGTNQQLHLQISGNYQPDATDLIRVMAYNLSGQAEGAGQHFALPAEVLSNPNLVFTLPLAPSDKLARYDIEILRNGQTLASTQYLFQRSGNSSRVENGDLSMEYPDVVKPGDQVTGKVSMKDGAGGWTDITSLAAFAVEGPIDQASLSHGSFRVAPNAGPGHVIRVKASVGSHEVTREIRVEGASNPAPVPPVTSGDVVMTINSKTFLVNGQPKETEVAPFIQNGRTFLPIRALAESFGATVEFNPDTWEILISHGDRKVAMVINSKTYRVNGVSKTMDVAPYIAYSGRTIVPVRFAAEALGYEITLTTLPNGEPKDILFRQARS